MHIMREGACLAIQFIKTARRVYPDNAQGIFEYDAKVIITDTAGIFWTMGKMCDCARTGIQAAQTSRFPCPD